MATFVLDGPLGEIGSPVAAAGLSLSTTAAFSPIPDGTQHLIIEGRNYSTAVVALVKLNPYLVVLRTQDAGATATDYSKNAQDGDTATDVTLSSQGTAAQGDFLYVGAHLPFRGVAVDVDAANATASVITVNYRKSDGTWADTSDTDGTASGGASLAVDGNITWTVPTDWVKTTLAAADGVSSAVAHANTPLYWTRWEFSGGLDSSTTLNSMLAMSRAKVSVGMQLTSGRVLALQVLKDVGGFGAIEAVTDAGTASLLVNCAAAAGGSFV
jgi:hypothetical protein